MIFVVEFVAAVDSAGTTQTVLVGTQGFTTGATDTPASASVRARLINAGEFARSIATGKLLLGQASAGFGECVIANQDGERVLRQQPLQWVLAHGGHLAALHRVDSAAGFSSKDPALPWRLTFTGYRAQGPDSPSGDGLYLQVDTWMTYLPQDETIMAYYELAVAKRGDGTAVIVDVRIDTERAGSLVFWRVRLQERGTDHVDHWVWPFTRGALMRKLPVVASAAPASAG